MLQWSGMLKADSLKTVEDKCMELQIANFKLRIGNMFLQSEI